MIKMDSYGTHLPLLVRCVAVTQGPVLELGCGIYSTPVLHALCHNRPLHSVESDAEWVKKFTQYSSAYHSVVLSKSPGEYLKKPWSVVLVDHAPAKSRAKAVEALANNAELIVCHDSEHRLYGYEPALAHFKYRVEWQRYAPWTTVVSNTMPLDFLNDLL